MNFYAAFPWAVTWDDHEVENDLFALLTSCQERTEVNPGVITNGPVDFTLDLTLSDNASLRSPGGYVVSNGVVVARTKHGRYVAASRTCTHQNNPAVEYQDDRFVCPVHGAQFDTSGRGLNDLGKKGIRVYKTDVDRNTLRVYS